MARPYQKRPRPPLDADQLEALALFYTGRYATSRAKLARYLERKITERGWDGVDPPPIEQLIARLTELRYVQDDAYAQMTSSAMQRRGLGKRRIAQALRHAGIQDDDGADALAISPRALWEAAQRLARRKRLGPFAQSLPDRPLRERQIAAFLRAGHAMDQARMWVDAPPGQFPPEPEDEE